MSRPSNNNPKSSSSSAPTPVAQATGWNVTRPSAAPLDDDDFFGVRSRTVKAAGILRDLKESAAAAVGRGGYAQGSSARPSLEVRMLFA